MAQKRRRTNQNENVLQWSNNNTNNNKLDQEDNRRNRLHNEGFKGDGTNYEQSEKIHASDFNYIFHIISTNLMNISRNLDELYQHVNSNKDEIDENRQQREILRSEYETNKKEHNNRINFLESYKINHEGGYNSLKKKVNTFIDTTFPNFKTTEFVATKNDHNSRINALEQFKITITPDSWVLNKIQNNRLELGNVLIKNKNGKNNPHLAFQDNDKKIYTLFSENDHFGLYDDTANRNVFRIDQDRLATFYGGISLNGAKLTGLSNSTEDNSAVNKKYVDNALRSVIRTNSTNTFTQDNNFERIRVGIESIYSKNGNNTDDYSIFNSTANYFVIKNITKNKELLSFDKNGHLSHGSVKDYIDNKYNDLNLKINNRLRKDDSNTLNHFLEMGNGASILFSGGDGYSYLLNNRSEGFSLSASGISKPLINFSGGRFRESILKEYIDKKYLKTYRNYDGIDKMAILSTTESRSLYYVSRDASLGELIYSTLLIHIPNNNSDFGFWNNNLVMRFNLTPNEYDSSTWELGDPFQSYTQSLVAEYNSYPSLIQITINCESSYINANLKIRKLWDGSDMIGDLNIKYRIQNTYIKLE